MSQLDSNLCAHTNIIAGLDAIQCRDCRRSWWQHHKDFERLLAQNSDPKEYSPEIKENFVIESDTESTSYGDRLSFADEPIHLYYPRGTANGVNQYFRFSYRDGKRMRHLHIPGGNTRSPQAIERAKRVMAFIDQGATPSQVRSLIEGWQKAKTRRNTLF